MPRPQGGFAGWIGESAVCEVRKSVHISTETHLKFGHRVQPEPLRLAYKRFFFDGMHAGYFSVGIDVPTRDLGSAQLTSVISALANLPVRSHHRPENKFNLASYGLLARDLYASGSVRGPLNLADQSIALNVDVGQPIIIVDIARRGHLDRLQRFSERCDFDGAEAFGRTIRWNGSTFMLAVGGALNRSAQRLLRAGTARLYIEVYKLERLIKLLQSEEFERFDDEGRAIASASVNTALRRLQGADRPAISRDANLFEYLLETFSRQYRPGYVADLDRIIERLKARPNLRRLLKQSYLTEPQDSNHSATSITLVEVTMGGKKIENTVQTGGVSISGGVVNTGGGSIAGNDITMSVEQSDQLNRVLDSLIEQIGSSAVSQETQQKATAVVDQIGKEAAKGPKASDAAIAKLLEGLVGLVPASVSAITSTFATPILGSVAGPVTKYVLERFGVAKPTAQ
jgi:hypothetical protein